ncbi:hypothetical protein L6452_38949 [Arctium lappa]|uniref:Uncharacterized protein n=1 Tax=Arctium lappa TaxID=4217 RepID=A0ACB8XRI1_ARCLA|nr:hypothetical protein L6452_38949 [Arctium lappa]
MAQSSLDSLVDRSTTIPAATKTTSATSNSAEAELVTNLPTSVDQPSIAIAYPPSSDDDKEGEKATTKREEKDDEEDAEGSLLENQLR